MNTRVSLACILLLSFGCQPIPGPHPSNVGDAAATPPDTISLACSHMKIAGCAEGADPNCVAVTTRAVNSGMAQVDLLCLDKPETITPETVRVCGQLCPLATEN